jgi:hypothetical protein
MKIKSWGGGGGGESNIYRGYAWLKDSIAMAVSSSNIIVFVFVLNIM